MVIQTNISALRTYRSSVKTTAAMAKNLEKLSSGYRINRSSDDASGLAVSERMRANITELDRCRRNALEGLNIAKTADGALAEVNDMLHRARELCIQAANGIYSEQELASISNEMNQLFSEVDRITAASSFNEIRLFRGNVQPDFHYEYDETFTALPIGDLESWGEMDFVKTEGFDNPPVAEAATVTFKLDDGIDFNDVSTLNGRAIQVGSYRYYFTDGTVNIPNDYLYNNSTISITGLTVERALNQFARLAAGSSYGRPAAIVIDKDARMVTMTAPLHELDDGTFEADGMTLPNKAPQGDGAWANGTVAAQNISGSLSLNQVDGQGIANNTPVYSNVATASINLSRLGDTLTPENVTNMMENTLRIGGESLALKDFAPSTSMTRDDFGKKLAEKISSFTDYEATYDNTAKQVKVTRKNQSAANGSAGYIYENTIPSTTTKVDTPMFTSNALNFRFSITTPASGERVEVCEVTVPPVSVPCSFSVNGTKYLYYDSSKHSLKQPGDESTLYDNFLYNTPQIIDVKGLDPQKYIVDNIASIISRQSGVDKSSIRINGDKITVTASSLNSPMNLSGRLKGISISVVSRKTVPDKPGTSAVFGGGYTYFQKEAAVPFSLGSEQNISKLVGSGFGIEYHKNISPGVTQSESDKFEFTNGTSLYTNYTDIDISGCTTFEQLKEKVQQVMDSKRKNTYTVELDTTDPNNTKLLISRMVSSNIVVTDGVTGIRGLISGSELVQYAGGTNTGYSQKAIDFSSVNSENLSDLLGRGFRINCATCSGEYINVFFCWENDGRVPPSFKVTDPATNEIRTIHNIAVELSKVDSGDQIVQDIVEQVRPTLKHFTDVEVGTPPTMLLAKEKRIGEVVVKGEKKLGEVQTGLEANFTYSLNIRKVEDYPADGSVAIKNTEVEIYVGSEPDPQIIPIHLPYLDLKTLRLSPPEVVDLNASGQRASIWLERVDRANLAISKVRSVIGADHNRLEHAIQSLSHARESLVDAESRIRDADMAEEMMTHVKLQILTQAQQSMLAQACSQPQQVLKLIS